jgi:voltage-gated sodium channel
MMDSYGNILHTFDKIIIAIFTIEAILKIIAYRFDYFKNGWNIFDFIIVVVSLVPTS